jgi:hypothetical protein
MDYPKFLETLDRTESSDRLKLVLNYMNEAFEKDRNERFIAEKKRQDEWDATEKKRQDEWDAAEKKRQNEWDAVEREKQRKWETSEKERRVTASRSLYNNLMNLKREMDSKTHNRKLQRLIVSDHDCHID